MKHYHQPPGADNHRFTLSVEPSGFDQSEMAVFAIFPLSAGETTCRHVESFTRRVLEPRHEGRACMEGVARGAIRPLGPRAWRMRCCGERARGRAARARHVWGSRFAICLCASAVGGMASPPYKFYSTARRSGEARGWIVPLALLWCEALSSCVAAPASVAHMRRRSQHDAGASARFCNVLRVLCYLISRVIS